MYAINNGVIMEMVMHFSNHETEEEATQKKSRKLKE